MLIRNAEIWQKGIGDVRIADGRIAAIGALAPLAGEMVRDAAGGALLPGLHDHHIHLAALAANRSSVACGPPEVSNGQELASALARPGEGWLRGVGYHESVAGMLDAAALDRLVPDRPVRIQHRSGRMWFLNSLAMDILRARGSLPDALDRSTGQLFDADQWLREALQGIPPDFSAISVELAAMGITGLTDMSPANDPAMADHFREQRRGGKLGQSCVLAGALSLAEAGFGNDIALGPAKLHLHDNALPDLDETIVFIRAAHNQGRAVATHCATEGELVFALAALSEAGSNYGDRIEHAGIAPDHLISEMAAMALWVVGQPHFIAERGDQYRAAIPEAEQSWLYRLASLSLAGITLAAGSDAPFGSPDPWAAMRAAVSRETRAGVVMGADEALTPEEAITLFLNDPLDLTRQRDIAVDAPADLCLLDRPWAAARGHLDAGDVALTVGSGSILHDHVNQTPIERGLCADPTA